MDKDDGTSIQRKTTSCEVVFREPELVRTLAATSFVLFFFQLTGLHEPSALL